MARSFARRDGRTARRQMIWLAGTYLEDTLASAGANTLVASLNAAALLLRPFTVVRTRGIVGIRSDQGAVSEVQQAAIGLIVVKDVAVVAGISSLPTPVTDDSSDWFTLQSMFNAIDVTSDIGRLLTYQQYEIDSKAMRKVDQGDDLAIVAENTGNSAGTIVSSYFRILIKLH